MNAASRKIFSAILHLSALAAAFLAFGWPFIVSRDQDSAAYHVIAVGVLLVFFASLLVLCGMRLRAGRGHRAG